jgi:ligand-binding SRPBCC domain-containing protein
MTTARTIRRSTLLDAPVDVVWAAVRTPQAFRFVTRGLVDWLPIRGRNDPWREGEEAAGRLLLGGVVPFSRHRIRVERLDDRERLLRSDESGGVIRAWRHDIRVEPADDGRTRYTDVIEIDAGPLTAFVAAFAWVFHGVRQCRWRTLATILDAVDRSGRELSRDPSHGRR